MLVIRRRDGKVAAVLTRATGKEAQGRGAVLGVTGRSGKFLVNER